MSEQVLMQNFFFAHYKYHHAFIGIMLGNIIMFKIGAIHANPFEKSIYFILWGHICVR